MRGQLPHCRPPDQFNPRQRDERGEDLAQRCRLDPGEHPRAHQRAAESRGTGGYAIETGAQAGARARQVSYAPYSVGERLDQVEVGAIQLPGEQPGTWFTLTRYDGGRRVTETAKLVRDDLHEQRANLVEFDFDVPGGTEKWHFVFQLDESMTAASQP